MKKQPITDITGAILAGGKSTRMGCEKALLPHIGTSFIEHIAGVMAEVFRDVIVVADIAGRYDGLGLRTYGDSIQGAGPLGGIHSALVHTSTERVCVVSCDMPALSARALRYLCGLSHDADVVAYSVGQRIQPLCAVYARRVLPLIERQLHQRRHSVLALLECVDTVVVPAEVSRKLDFSAALVNINTPAEYRWFAQRSLLS
jgi:molybdopterin-guanine dinucleotide biosynthesis protein A